MKMIVNEVDSASGTVVGTIEINADSPADAVWLAMPAGYPAPSVQRARGYITAMSYREGKPFSYWCTAEGE